MSVTNTVKVGANNDELNMVFDIIQRCFNTKQMKLLHTKLEKRLKDNKPF